AALAFHLHENGDRAAAMNLVAQVHRSVPHLGFHHWIADWLEHARSKGLPVDPMPLLHALIVCTSFGVGRLRLLAAECAAAEEMVPLARLAVAAVPGDGRVALIASSVLRRAGRWQEALDVADRAATNAAPEQVQTVRGLALRGLRAFDGALDAFDRGFAASGDAVYLMERMRVLADAGRWADALETWAKFGAASAPDEENVLEHQTIQRAAQANAPAPDEPPLDIVRRRALGHGYLFRMQDASANALRQVAADPKLRAKGPADAGAAIRSGNVTMAVSGPEGPSNRLCQALMFAGQPDPRLAAYTGTDDVDLGREATQYTLWRRDGDVIVQALPPPPAPVSDWIERIALRELDGSVAETAFETSADFLDMWNVASRTAPPAASARDWVAATIYPRMPVVRVCGGPEWVYRWQVAALIGLALCEPGWKATARRTALMSLLEGPVDWPLAAAIRVSAELALREPDATREIRQMLIDLTYRHKGERNGAIVQTLLGALEMIPYVPAEHVDRLRKALAAADQDASEDDDSAPAPEGTPKGGKRPWWKLWG
ncbi:MAG TPA: hypothetical protein VN903_22215, partial [Polyangia bacterium]|nr:hypothetical protein [Polyangia bacterium]